MITNRLTHELIDTLQQAYEWIASNSEAGAQQVARIQNMNPKQTQELVRTWKAENPMLNRINHVLDKVQQQATTETTEDFPMVPGEGAPQYTFALPDEPTQLAMI